MKDEEDEDNDEEEDTNEYKSACERLKKLLKENPDTTKAEKLDYLVGLGLTELQIDTMKATCPSEFEEANEVGKTDFKVVGNQVYCLVPEVEDDGDYYPNVKGESAI